MLADHTWSMKLSAFEVVQSIFFQRVIQRTHWYSYNTLKLQFVVFFFFTTNPYLTLCYLCYLCLTFISSVEDRGYNLCYSVTMSHVILLPWKYYKPLGSFIYQKHHLWNSWSHLFTFFNKAKVVQSSTTLQVQLL